MTNDNSQYIKDAIKTESTDFEAMAKRISSKESLRLLHSAIGLATEAGEIQDCLKKHIFYGKDLDRVNLKEEMGDVFWYLAILADELGVDFTEVMEKNIQKLKARYGEKFTEEKAANRNLTAERQILEQDLH